MDAKQSLVRNWLNKARRDLLSAKRLARGSFEKTHDLRLRVTLASEIEPRFTEWFDIAELIAPYATAYRYPGEILEPTEEEF